ncbi:hypothetical protein PRIPAC_74057 [Pristionchus pacificus]|nr:hypothetical protein PRIPAC_74057 [Pristionchus pacificus]
MGDAARLAEAAECEKKAAECLKTSMLKMKFKPDFDGAASALERASVCYRNSSQPQKAAKALQDAAVNYEQCNNRFHAAKAREGAAMLLRDAGDAAGAFPLFEAAIDGYAESGSLDTAAMTVEKAAKVISEMEPEKAIKLYEKGLALVQQSDRSKMAGEFLSAITRLSLRLEDYPRACAAIRDEIEKYLEVRETLRIGQLAIAMILVKLAMEDSIAASSEYFKIVQECPEFQSTDDAAACESLIASYEAGNDSAFQNALKRGSLRSMDNEYLRLQRKLKVPVREQGDGEEDIC